MSLTVQIEPLRGATPSVAYRWDTDTDILSAQVEGATSEGPAATVEVQGLDGSWMILDVRGGRIRGVEVAVWPDVRKLPALTPPSFEPGEVVLPPRHAAAGASAVDSPLSAEVDDPERVFHFRFGPGPESRAIQVANDILVDVEPSGAVAGIWFLNVPPFPLDQ
jgi:uncharacterized protein YuzE